MGLLDRLYILPTIKDLEKEVAIDEINRLYETGEIAKEHYEKLMSDIKQKEKKS